MNILVYGISNQKGGISEFMMDINENIKDKDLNFTYIIKGNNSIYESKIAKMNGKVCYYNYNNKFKRIINLYKIMKNERKNTNIFYFNTSGVYFVIPIIFAKMLNYKIISHAHSGKDINLNKIHVILNIINRQLLKRIANIKFTCSDVAKEWVYGKDNNVIQINNTINPKKFFYSNYYREKYRNEFGFSDKDLVLVSVGRVEYPKNQMFLIEIMRKLNEIDDRYKLLIVGNGADYEKLNKFVQEKNVRNIFFLGQRSDINNLLNASDIFMLPSFYEGFPIVVVEAQATGMQCMISDTITKSCNITNRVKFLSLSNQEKWIREILNYKNIDREDLNHVLNKNGFDQDSVTEKVYKQIRKIMEE